MRNMKVYFGNENINQQPNTPKVIEHACQNLKTLEIPIPKLILKCQNFCFTSI